MYSSQGFDENCRMMMNEPAAFVCDVIVRSIKCRSRLVNE